MKPYKTTYILSAALWIIWILSIEAKEFCPDIFGLPAIQWSSAVIVAVLAPTITLFALKLFTDKNHRKHAFWLTIIATVPIIYNLSVHSILGTSLARTQAHMTQPFTQDAKVISTITSQMIDLDSVDSRERAAEHLYGMFGVQGVWKNSDGKLEQYIPSGEAQVMLKESVDISSMVEQTNNLIDSQLKQMPWLFMLHLGSFTSIIILGLAWYTFKST